MALSILPMNNLFQFKSSLRRSRQAWGAPEFASFPGRFIGAIRLGKGALSLVMRPLNTLSRDAWEKLCRERNLEPNDPARVDDWLDPYPMTIRLTSSSQRKWICLFAFKHCHLNTGCDPVVSVSEMATTGALTKNLLLISSRVKGSQAVFYPTHDSSCFPQLGLEPKRPPLIIVTVSRRLSAAQWVEAGRVINWVIPYVISGLFAFHCSSPCSPGRSPLHPTFLRNLARDFSV